MTRTAREISVYGYYHVVQKGCGGQLIFEDVDDRLYLIRLIASKCQKFKVDVIAWCLMDNHIHLLLDDGHAHLSDCMHSITTAYAMYFNSKTGRRGPVFQDRFKSVPILDDDQLLNCVRYIHDNPAKARIGTASLYRWSSLSLRRRCSNLTSLTISKLCPRTCVMTVSVSLKARAFRSSRSCVSRASATARFKKSKLKSSSFQAR